MMARKKGKKKMTQEEVEELVKELKKRLKEIEKLKKALGIKKVWKEVPPTKTMIILEEIKVPSLKALKEKE